MSIGMRAERFRSAGYFARKFSKRASSSGEKVILPVRISKDEIHAAEGRDYVCNERAFDQPGSRLQVAKAGAAPVDAIRLLRAVAHHVAADFTARRLHCLIHLAL